jgi:hypothetical protein
MIHWWLMKEDVPPVRLCKSSTLVKAKTSAPLPLPSTSCAALTQRALGALSPHREGTRSRRCGRRLTGGTRREPLTSGPKMNLGTVWAAPADWGPVPPHQGSLCMDFLLGARCIHGNPNGSRTQKTTHIVLAGEAGFRGRASPNFRSEVGPPNSCQEYEHAPRYVIGVEENPYRSL